MSSVPSQSGKVKLIPNSSSDSRALLNGSAQLKMLALGPPISCAPFKYRLNVSDVPITTGRKGQNQAAAHRKVRSFFSVEGQQNKAAKGHTPADHWQRAVLGD